MNKAIKEILIYVFPLIILFSILYSILGIVRFNNYGAFGYDLGINDQTVWKYSNFKLPITTIDPFPELSKLAAHIELIYIFIAPFYWIWSDPRMLIVLQVLFITISGIPIYLIGRKKNLNKILCLSVLIAYYMFFGVQNALWFDVHSIVFAAGIIPWFIYFLEKKDYLKTLPFFITSIISKENVAFITLSISFVYFIKNKNKKLLVYILLSIFYLLFAYIIFFPKIMNVSYLYKNEAGILSNLSPFYFFNSPEKLKAIFYSFLSFGFLPFLSPLFLIPIFAHFFTYFVLASDLKSSHTIFMHYRVMLSPLLAVAVINSLQKLKKINFKILSFWIIIFSLFMQYYLHLPLSYLSKSWFWTKPSGVDSINRVITNLDHSSVVAQNNIVPHISQRDKIYFLYPEKIDKNAEEICGEKICDWFRWYGNPKYLIVDFSKEWDLRHLLTDRNDFIKGINNLEKTKIIMLLRKDNNTSIYRVLKNPSIVYK